MPVVVCEKCKALGDCSGDICSRCGIVMTALQAVEPETLPKASVKTRSDVGKKPKGKK